MDSLKFFLEKFKNLQNPKQQREEIAVFLSNFFNLSINEKDITLKKGCITISNSVLPKTELLFKSEILLQEIKKKFPKLGISRVI